MSKVDQTQGGASRAIDRLPPPRDRGCEMTFETEGRDRRVAVSFRFQVFRPRDGVLEISATEGESKSKLCDVCVRGDAQGGRDVGGVWRRSPASRTWGTNPLSKKVRWGRGWWRQRSITRSTKRLLVCGNAVVMNTTNVDSIDAQPLTWDVVNLGASEPRESVPLRELGTRIPWYC